MAGAQQAVVDEDGVPLPYEQMGNYNYQAQAGDDDLLMFTAPSRSDRIRWQVHWWNGDNHYHYCNHYRCLLSTSLRWVARPHCSCRMPSMAVGHALDQRICVKRITCRHKPRHRMDCTSNCKCGDIDSRQKSKLPVEECDLSKDNPTGDLAKEECFIDT
ncbi:hypothetical protein M758_UG012600 [Ceratodon purpureus]|nr:hypothetical protein M758_UG012600 [Ceratodon purpureus]